MCTWIEIQLISLLYILNYFCVVCIACDDIIHWNEVWWKQDPVYRENHLSKPRFIWYYWISLRLVFSMNTLIKHDILKSMCFRIVLWCNEDRISNPSSIRSFLVEGQGLYLYYILSELTLFSIFSFTFSVLQMCFHSSLLTLCRSRLWLWTNYYSLNELRSWVLTIHYAVENYVGLVSEKLKKLCDIISLFLSFFNRIGVKSKHNNYLLSVSFLYELIIKDSIFLLIF